MDTPKTPFLFIEISLALGGAVFALMDSTKPSEHWLPRLEERAVGGCAAYAGSWPGRRPKRVGTWSFRQGGRLASAVESVAGPLPASQRHRPRGRGRGRRQKAALPSSEARCPSAEPSWRPAASSTAGSEAGRPVPRSRCAAGAVPPPASSRRSPGNALPPRPSPLPPAASWGLRARALVSPGFIILLNTL